MKSTTAAIGVVSNFIFWTFTCLKRIPYEFRY